MTAEITPEAQLKEKRINYASDMLDTHMLGTYIYLDTWIHETKLPDYIEWKEGSDLGDGNVYIKNVLLGRFFNSQEEFLTACRDLNTYAASRGASEPHIRDFKQEIDTDQFPIDVQKYTVIKVFSDGNIALAGKTDTNGEFSIDVYPSKNFKKDMLESCIEMTQKNIEKTQKEIDRYQDKITNFKDQIKGL